MKIFTLVLAMLCMPLMAFAGNISSEDISSTFNRLSEAERATMAAQMATMVENRKDSATEMLDPDNLQKWVSLGSSFGTAIAEAAGKLGIAADEFLKSFAGKLIAMLIVWKVMGVPLFGMFFLFISIALWWAIVSHFWMEPAIKLVPIHRKVKATKEKKASVVTEKRELLYYKFTSNESAGFAWLMLVILVGASVIMVVAG